MKSKIFVTFLVTIFFLGCNDDYQPKPVGYVRIALPNHAFKVCDDAFFMTFRYSNLAKVVVDPLHQNMEEFLNIEYPQYKATIHLSYKPVINNFDTLTEDARAMALKHIQKAETIQQTLVENDSNNVYGIIYDIAGSTVASPFQFFITDTTNHFLRGALYFNIAPNNDSLMPVIKYIRKDIDTLINTLQWK